MTAFLDFLTARGAVLQDGRATHFGTPEQEFRAFRTEAALVPLLSVTPLRLTGTDRLDFLHGQVTNEVKRLEVGRTNEALMLNIKGHALAQMRIYRRQDDLFVAVEGGKGPEVQAQFQAHIIFDQVEIHNLSDQIVSFTVQGPRAPAVVQQVLALELPPAEEFTEVPFASAKVLAAPVRRSQHGGYDLHVLTRDAEELVGAVLEQGAVLAGEEALETARVEAGIPAAHTEAGEGVLPQEAGLEGAISYRKGCYLGQEIMARIEARGNVRRALRTLRLQGVPDGSTRDITSGGKLVGRLGTVVLHPEQGVTALGVLRTDLAEDAELAVGGLAVTARVER
jgi:folate-binding protein YgfZ